MASETETIRLNVEANSDGVEQLSDRLRDARGRFVTLGEAARATTIPMVALTTATNTYAVGARDGIDVVARFARNIDITAKSAIAAAAAARENESAGIAYTKSLLAADAAARSGTRGVADFGRSVLMVSQGIEDAQYGISAVVNNIPMIVMAMGGGPGLAGAVSLVSVGVAVLARHWDDLTAAFGAGHVKTQAEEMAELAKQTSKSADEMKRLADYNAHEAGADKVIGAPTEKQAKSAAAVDKALAEVENKPALARKIADAQEKEFGLSLNPEEQAALDRAKALKEGKSGTWNPLTMAGDIGRVATGGAGMSETNEQRGAREEKEVYEAARGRHRADALRDLDDSGRDPNKLRANVERLRGMGENGLADKLQKADPETIKAEAMKAEGRQHDDILTQQVEFERKEAEKLAKIRKDDREEEKKHRHEIAEAEKKAQAEVDGRARQQEQWEAEGRKNAREYDLKHAEDGYKAAHGGMTQAENEKQGKARGISREGAFEDRLGAMSGISNPIEQAMLQARYSGRGSGADLNMQRRFSRMTMDERMQYDARRNDATDETLVRQSTQMLLRGGVTRDPRRAEAIARSQVAQARERTNGANGDIGTKAAEDNTKSLEKLTEKITTMTQDGVKLVLADD